MTKHVNVPDDAYPDTYHIERHDDHKVDAHTSARRGKLPVLLNKMPVEGSKLLHCNKTENHNSEHGCQNKGDLSRDDGEKEGLQFGLSFLPNGTIPLVSWELNQQPPSTVKQPSSVLSYSPLPHFLLIK